MKRQFAMLFALTFLVSGMATIAEGPQEEKTESQIEFVETADAGLEEWVAPFEDGEWLTIPEWNAELYLPMGWQLVEVSENGFVVGDADAASHVTVTMEDFLIVESEETQADGAEEDAENAEPSAFELHLMENGEEYEMAIVGEREMGVLTGEESIAVKFLMRDKLVTMDFAPVTEGGIADSALAIAETFYMYDAEETVEESIEETAGEETTIEESVE